MIPNGPPQTKKTPTHTHHPTERHHDHKHLRGEDRSSSLALGKQWPTAHAAEGCARPLEHGLQLQRHVQQSDGHVPKRVQVESLGTRASGHIVL